MKIRVLMFILVTCWLWTGCDGAAFDSPNCTCSHGLAATGIACTSDNAAICVSCDPGFHPDGDACSPKSCTETRVANSDKSTGKSISGIIGERVTVTCNDGYEGSGTVICQTSGIFSALTCRACDPGTYSTGGVDCKDCVAGEHAATSGTALCTDCDAGSDTNDQAGQTSCTTCAGGEYAESAGTADCIPIADLLCGVKVVAYYPHYGRYRMPVADIQYQHLTDVIFSFLRVAADGTLIADHPATLQRLVDAAHAEGVRVQASVAGEFLEMADDGDGSRARFLSELKAMAISYDLDGVDFDWEGSAFSASARTLYAELVEAAAAELTPLGMSLSVATVTWRNELPASALSHLTSMNCMGYDAGPPEHSSLQDGVDVVQHWVNVGAAPDKLLMGTAFYALKADWSAITWADLVASYAPGPEVDAVGGWGFPGVNTTAAKVKYVMDGGFGGIMIWELSQDTLDETSLLATIGKTIRDHCSRE